MGSAPQPAKRGRLLRRLMAGGMAMGLHFLVFLGLGRVASQLNIQTSRDDEANAISVVMVQPPSRSPSTAAPSGKVRLKDRRNATVAAPVATTIPSPPAPALAAPAPRLDTDAFRKTLQGLAGCADPASDRFGPQERTNCDRRAAPPPSINVQLDPREQAAFDADGKQEQLLIRKPHNGCLPRAGDRKSALVNAGRGTSMAATTTGGVGCAWSF